MMASAFPRPWMSGIIFFSWLLMMGEVKPLVVIGALFFAWGLPKLTSAFVPSVSAPTRPSLVIRLMVTVTKDIVMSNIVVARQVLGNVNSLTPAFITVPVDTDHDYVINLLASIITMTPGTVSARVHETPDTPGSSIVVHVLNCEDEQALIDDIKARYEQPLLEIFNCSPSH